MQTIRFVLDVLGYISTVIVIIAAITTATLWIRGIAPALLRLGNGLSRRKIALFGKGDALNSLKSLLLDSRLFRKSNLIEISHDGDIGKAESAMLFLVYWPDWTTKIVDILEKKRDGAALIVYAPQDKGSIPLQTMTLLNSKRNVVVSNMRGRLLNDVVISLITTSNEKY